MKRILLAIALLFFGTAAAATELVTDPTLTVNPFTAMGSNWSASGGKLIGSGVYGSRAGQSISIPALTKVRYTVTISAYTSGNIQLSVGAPVMSVPGTSKPVTDGANGLIHIPDNFTSSLGLYAGQTVSSDPNHSNATFRFTCQGNSKIEASDPMVVPRQPGKSHLHRFDGNQGVNAYSTYETLRRSGADNCGNGRYSPHRSAYWHPPFLNGKGAVVFPIWQQYYYRQIPNGASVCNPPMVGGVPQLTGNYVGKCVMIPNGLRYLSGYDMASGTGGPTDSSSTDSVAFGFECRQRANMSVRDTTANGYYSSLDAVRAAGCPLGAVLYVSMEGKDCWNGTEVDSADHRSHMSWYLPIGTPDGSYSFMASDGLATGPKCPQTHPYKVPTFAWQQFYITDQDFYDGHWRLSSDEMLTGSAVRGKTLHMDYWEAWGDFKLGANGWHQRCINEGRSCNEGGNGNGLQFLNPATIGNIQYNGGGSTTNLTSVTMKPTSRVGLSRPISGTGTFTGELIALTGDQIYITSPDGFVGEIDYVSFDTTTPVSRRDGTITHTSH